MGLILGFVLIFIGKEFIGFLYIENVIVERDVYYYLVLNGLILFFIFFNIFYVRILGSFGNNKLVFKINVLGLVLNIIFDLMFIYIFKFGVLGVVILMLIVNIIMFIVYLVKFFGIFKFNF